MKIEIDVEAPQGHFLQAICRTSKKGRSVTDKGAVLNDLVKQLTEMTLQAELESYLAQDFREEP